MAAGSANKQRSRCILYFKLRGKAVGRASTIARSSGCLSFYLVKRIGGTADSIPQIAFAHHFLLHGILAFSALHLAHLQPERKAALYAEASAHHDIGLRMFQIAMSSVTRENCDACFAFSSLVASYTWVSSEQTNSLFFRDEPAPKEKSNVEWVSLVRGVHTLMKASGQWIMSGPMGPMLQTRHMEPELVRAVDPEGSAKLATLRQLWSLPTTKFNVDGVQALEETLVLILSACGLIASASTDSEIDIILVVLSWPVHIPEAFLAMVKEQKPEALVLLAHYSLILNKVDHLWYMRGMSRRLLKLIHGKIGKQWESWIAWPLQNLVLAEFQD
ncbi:hypothetical protein GQ53DRAFT_762659 [Thozetella sp. PMI_491]|nr:hypothetical protein GQ53DRAFT_762659 [Thozetella sp. PMI_491]